MCPRLRAVPSESLFPTFHSERVNGTAVSFDRVTGEIWETTHDESENELRHRDSTASRFPTGCIWVQKDMTLEQLEADIKARMALRDAYKAWFGPIRAAVEAQIEGAA